MYVKRLFMVFIFFGFACLAQEQGVTQDSLPTMYRVEGDSLFQPYIALNKVVLLNKLQFKDKEARRNYFILRRRVHKVYPYAKMASERLSTMNARLKTIKKRSKRKRYTRRIQKYVEGEFTEELKKLTRKEGQILVKLIHRQTGYTAFQLVKELRTGWRAFWYQSTAKLFDISLKIPYNPLEVQEDYLMEDILQRAFQNNQLEYQDAALEIDFLSLVEKWNEN